MILNLLKENLLKEDINLDEPDIKTSKFSIYKINQRTDLDSFTLSNGENVGEHFGLTESNWSTYVQSGSCIVLVITAPSTKPQSEVVGAMLVWSGSMNNFPIRGSNAATVQLPITFESVTSTDNTAYFRFITEFEATLPLKAILLKYDDFCNQAWRDNLDPSAEDGSYVKSEKLQGVYEEFYSLNADGNYNYTDLIFNEGYSQLQDSSIDWKNRAWSNMDTAPTWKITWTNDVRQWTDNCITEDSLPHILFDFQGDEELKTQIKDSFSEEVANKILYDNETEEDRSARLAREEEARRQAQHEADLAKAQEWDDAVSRFLDRNEDANVDIDDLNDFNQRYVNNARELFQMWSSDLTETQQSYTTKHEELSAFIENQVQLYNNLIEVEAQNRSRDLLEKINNLQHRVDSADYIYSLNDARELQDIENRYNNLTVDYGQRVKDIIAETLNFEETITNLKTVLQTKKDELLQQKAQRFTEQGLILFDGMLVCKQINSKEIAIVGSKKITSEDLDIPSEINGIKVTRIAPSAFAYNTSLRDKFVYIPKTIRYIGNLAFYNCGARRLIFQPSNLNQVQLGRDCLNLFGADSRSYENRPTLDEFNRTYNSDNVIRISGSHWN